MLRAATRRFASEERGSVTAEFALTIPAVLLVLGIAVASIHLAAERVALVSLAADVARLEARGDAVAAQVRVAERPGVRLERSSDSRVLCVRAESSPARGLLSVLSVSVRGCAAISEATPETGGSS